MRSERIAALTGVAFVVVVVIGLLIGGEPPDAGSPVDEIVAEVPAAAGDRYDEGRMAMLSA